LARKSIEDVMNEIEDFMNSCKTTALSSNKVVVPRDEFDELFGDLKVKIPAEIDRCKKIMRNKEAILMDARNTADGIMADATNRANLMISETEIMHQANQQAYETVEMARVQANEILANATAEANELRLGAMQYTNDIMMGLKNYIEATANAERANYENLLSTLQNDLMIANSNVEEIQGQIVAFTGNPASVTRAPQMKTAANGKAVPPAPKAKQSMMDKVKQAVGGKEDKPVRPEEAPVKEKPEINVPDLVATGVDVVPNDIPLEATVPNNVPPAQTAKEAAPAQNEDASEKKVKKVVRRRNPVVHTPQTAQETVAKTLEAAQANKVDKTSLKPNGIQDREVPPMEGNVKRGPRMGRPVVENNAPAGGEKSAKAAKSVGTIDDYTMDKKI